MRLWTLPREPTAITACFSLPIQLVGQEHFWDNGSAGSIQVPKDDVMRQHVQPMPLRAGHLCIWSSTMYGMRGLGGGKGLSVLVAFVFEVCVLCGSSLPRLLDLSAHASARMERFPTTRRLVAWFRHVRVASCCCLSLRLDPQCTPLPFFLVHDLVPPPLPLFCHDRSTFG